MQFICDFCGYQTDSRSDVNNHIREVHKEEPATVGSLEQEDGILTLRQADGEETVIDLAESLREMLGPQPTTPQPDLIELIEWQGEGGCQATDGCWVETDGRCIHGHPSWLLRLGLI